MSLGLEEVSGERGKSLGVEVEVDVRERWLESVLRGSRGGSMLVVVLGGVGSQ